MEDPSAEDPMDKGKAPAPDTKDWKIFKRWLKEHITSPFRGFEDKRHRDGTPYTKDEQVFETRKQFMKTRREFPQMGMSQEDTSGLLRDMSQDLKATPKEFADKPSQKVNK